MCCKEDTLHYSACNLQSSVQHVHKVLATLAAECDKGFLSGRLDHSPLDNFVSSGLGMVPKKTALGDLSVICQRSWARV